MEAGIQWFLSRAIKTNISFFCDTVLAYRYIGLFIAWVLSVSFHCKFGWAAGTMWTMQRVFTVFPN
jgi:hypothetical protein